MSLKITLSFATFLVAATSGYNQTFDWAKRMGGAGNGTADVSQSLAIDGNGNVYTTGHFTGTADFDPGAGTFNMTSAGSSDIFVSKLDANGDFVWAKRMGGSSVDAGFSLAIDGSGNVYTTGGFNGTADFDPGAGTFNMTAAGGDDIFISKLDSNGDFMWAKRIGGSGVDIGFSLAVDSNGNVFTTGYFFSTADFNPGAGTFNMTTAGGSDIFVSKLDANGDFVWAKRMGGSSGERGNAINTDSSGNVFTTGYFAGTVDFDPGAGTFNMIAAGGTDIFISKLDANGVFVWAKQMGGSSSDGGYSIVTDASGNVYTTGSFQGTADFDPGAGTFNMASAGSRDIFISKLDINGDFVWAKRKGSTTFDRGNSITIDVSSNVYTTGFFTSTADFDPGAGTFNMVAEGGFDIFISKLNVNGDFLWAGRMGGSNDEQGLSIAIDDSGNICTTGYFYDTGDFDPDTGTFNLVSAGLSDIFVLKLTPLCIPDSGFQSETACDSFTWAANAQTYTNSGTYLDTLINTMGCDSIVSLNLTIRYSKDTTVDISSCDSLLLANMWIFSDTIFSDTLSTIDNCDSVVNYQVTINYSILTSDSTTSCSRQDTGIFTTFNTSMNGCDSIHNHVVTLSTAIINEIELIGCDSIFIDSQWFFADTIYTDSLLAINSCDSITTYDITLNYSVKTFDTITTCSSADTGRTFIINENTVNGCDSIHNRTVLLEESPIGILDSTDCDSIKILGTTYFSDTTINDTLIGLASNGCDSIVQISLTILDGERPPCSSLPTENCELIYANIFTPNSDGINDLLTINDPCNTNPSVNIEIYNRWGQLMWQASNSKYGWDGTVNGQPASEGVYYFIYQGEIDTHRGSFTLVR